jgi:hypothetical protein
MRRRAAMVEPNWSEEKPVEKPRLVIVANGANT